MDFTALVDQIVPVPGPLRKVAANVLGLAEVSQLYQSISQSAHGIPEKLLNRLAITYLVGERDLQQIPKTGSSIVVANHPFGMLEGAVLATILKQVRSDIRILANEALSAVPEIRDLLIPVDAMNGGIKRNAQGLRRAIQFLQNGGCLVVFPAGEVSSFRPKQWKVEDPAWKTTVARLVETLARTGLAPLVTPIYIEGTNSLLFQTLGLIHPRLRTLLLFRELLNKKNGSIELRIGNPISAKKLLEISTAEERTNYLRWRTYLLANRPGYKTHTSVPLRTSKYGLDAIGAPVSADLISTEIESLTPLSGAGELEVYVAEANEIPYTLREIGRLRELTFRAAGEGTGRPFDLDRFDEQYLHLFAWNPLRREIVGAYRLIGTDISRDLYTKTLFRYGDAFLDKLGPALELGRSFVRLEYQRGFAPLLALWKGIGALIARNPRYKVLFGAVSISNQYQVISRELMVTFLERHASLREWRGLISNRNAFRKRRSAATLPSNLNIEQLSDVVADIEPSRIGVPVLLRQYLKLGGKLLGFNVDPEFSDTLDGLILVDLTQTEPRLLERYLGKKGNDGTQ